MVRFSPLKVDQANCAMKIEIEKNSVCDPPSKERIEWFEKAYRIKLPESFVQFLAYANCGVPVKEKTFFVGNKERLIERFLCITNSPKQEPDKGIYDITVVATQLDERLVDDPDMIGMNLIPIATLFAGDFVCLDYRESKDNPKVVVWDHEQSDEFAPATEVVANSFDEFLELLKRH